MKKTAVYFRMRKREGQTQGVNFINSLLVHFSYKSAFLPKRKLREAISYEKCARKMLMKLTQGERDSFLSIVGERRNAQVCSRQEKGIIFFSFIVMTNGSSGWRGISFWSLQ